MFSWGQDTWSTSAPRCAVRGYDSARYGDHHSSWYNYVGLGFRPVLEVLNTDPLISDTDRDLGDKNNNFTIQYTVNDADPGDVLTATGVD